MLQALISVFLQFFRSSSWRSGGGLLQDEPGMDDEEDVVFEGSAIHQHLLDVGLTDFEQSTYLPPPVQEKTQEGTTSTLHKKTGWQERQQQWCTVFPHHLFGTVANLLQQYICTSVARTVFGSKLVSEDDCLILEHFLPEAEKLQDFAKPPFPWQSILVPRDLAVVSLCLVLLWMVTEDWLVQFGVFLVAVAVYTIYCIYLLWRSTALKQFVITLKETVYLTSKTVRLVQEVDLIAKGFVLAQGPGAALATPYEVPPQITHLSEALLSTMTSAAKVLLSTHTLLEHRVPHHPTIRHLFDELPPLDGCCTFSERKQYLKDNVTVIKLQASAVVTKLLLWLYKSEGLCEYKTFSDDISTHMKQAAFLDKLQFLKKQYEYNKSFWLTERPSRSESQFLEEKKKNVYLAIHSLALHLQAALVRVQSLEAEFERESDTANFCDSETLPSFPSHEHVKKQLTALRLELDSCQGCIEEAEARAERKYGIADSSDVKETDRVESTTKEEHVEDAKLTKPIPVLLYDQEVSPAEDEVFEAYIDQEFVNEDKSKWEDEPWCADARKERQVFRQQKEQGKRVLKELQPILTSRRKMWEEREKIALERHGKIVGMILPFDEEHTKESKRGECSRRKDSTNDFNSPNFEDAASCGSSAVAAVQSQLEGEEEEDSDEERLRVYRKVKKELDEDEEERLATEVRLGGKLLNFGQDLGGLQSLINRNESTDYIDSDSEEEKSKIVKLPLVPNMGQCSMTQQSSEDLTDNVEEAENVKDTSTLETNPSPDNRCTRAEIFSTGEKEMGKEASSESVAKQEDETFLHNEAIDDNESRKIDWTTFRLPIQQTDTLDDRLQLFSGGACLGFQAEVAAKASAASRNFWMAAKCPEKTFGGIGEGEGEVFGSDSDREEGSDSDAQLN